MPKSIPWRKLVRRFRELGFGGPYSGGRHLFVDKNGFKVRIPNPHRGDVDKHLVSEILRQAGIKPEDWEKRK